MEPIIHCIYGYINPNGDTLQLRLGRIKPEKRNHDDKDTGYRWSFVGKKIPMPVWSGDWFKGHPEPIMTEWLMKHGGWAKAFMVDMVTNKTEVYELPKANDFIKEVYFVATSTGIVTDMFATEGDAMEFSAKLAKALGSNASVFKAEEIARTYHD